ncbi:MAG: PQQ-binding-like beta-propeller repeat protein [Verrucomicrobiales bacterium]
MLWTAEVEPGHSGAAIVDGKVYVMDRVDSEKDVLRVMDLQSGESLGSGEIESPGRVNFPGSRTVPTVTDQHIFTAGPMGVVAGWKRDDLSLLWSVDVIKKFGAEPLHVGFSINPQAYRDLVIISVFSKEASVVALRASTGEVVWSTPGLYGSLATPMIRKFQGRDQILYISNETPEEPKGDGASSVAGLDPMTGEVLWRYEDFPMAIPIPPPVVVDTNKIFVTGGYEAGAQLLAIDPGARANISVLKKFKWGSQICPPIVYQDNIYFLAHENDTLKDEDLWPEVGLHCVSTGGEKRWNTGGEPMFGRGSMIIADGKILIRDSYFGKLYMVAPSPDGYRQLAMANPFNRERRDRKQWAPLAISNGLLIIRGGREIKCLDLRKL